MSTVRIISWIARVAFMATMVLGLLFWIIQLNLISLHMLFGITGVLALLVLSVVAIFTKGIRSLGTVSAGYAILVPIFGLTQSTLLIGNLHWLIQTAHLLVGIGAMGWAQVIDRRYRAVAMH
ncbi:MAG TPA: hypothetical protein VKB76_13965 [Ktedonobacterales bacterium]|nr:hypothetical protein [Ktedonobacterales bacterium]